MIIEKGKKSNIFLIIFEVNFIYSFVKSSEKVVAVIINIDEIFIEIKWPNSRVNTLRYSVWICEAKVESSVVIAELELFIYVISWFLNLISINFWLLIVPNCKELHQEINTDEGLYCEWDKSSTSRPKLSFSWDIKANSCTELIPALHIFQERPAHFFFKYFL